MGQRNFRTMLESGWGQGKFVCVGLDSTASKIPKEAYVLLKEENVEDLGGQTAFNCNIVDATHDLVLCYKPNSAFYEARGIKGMQALYQTIRYINKVAPELPVILDAKRADIDSTNDGYVEAAFGELMLVADAITVNPYFGGESLEPFFLQKEKGIIVLCRTSNKGAKELQELIVDIPYTERCEINGRLRQPISTGVRLYQYVAYRAATLWNRYGNCCVVVGATHPHELECVRLIVADMPILIPGIGAQGGDLEETLLAGKDSRGYGMIINSSRQIIFASSGQDFAQAARAKTQELHQSITHILKGSVS